MSRLQASRQSLASPLPGEVLDLARLREAAVTLARRLPAIEPAWFGRGSRRFRRRVRADLDVLDQTYGLLAADVHGGAAIAPSAEWLLDNFHLIKPEGQNVRHNLPPSYYRRLPRIDNRSGGTRIETLADEVIGSSDARLDAERLREFLLAFQTVSPLSIGELWAWPTVLKVALVSHVARLARRLAAARADGHAADAYLAAADQARAHPVAAVPSDASAAFAVRLIQRLREYGSTGAALHARLDDWLSAHGVSAEDVVHVEGQREAAEQISMANAISSLRLAATLDWSRFFESVSAVEHVLQRDPTGVYSQMDFLTRDQYRRAVEHLAGRTGDAQVSLALVAVDLARRASSAGADERTEHVGYYLIGGGTPLLEAATACRGHRRRACQRACARHATALYLGTIAVVTTLVVLAAMTYSDRVGSPAGLLVALLVALPASELTIRVVHHLISLFVAPTRLPRLNLEGGVPSRGRTMVIVPTLIPKVEDVESLLAHLEVQALGNQDPWIHFAVLSDFTDADTATVGSDDAILAALRAGIDRLNDRYGSSRFFLFHRVRRWNASEGRWMGWERKRGKIEEFVALLRGAADTTFSELRGDLAILPEVAYCITLDTDTRLPRDTAQTLIGIALHPLNQPRIDRATGLVTEGYGIVQPRVSVTFDSAAGSVFARVYAGHTGVDPYTTAVSDVYQDVFHEGIFTGKGLLHVDTFHQTLRGRVPENALLSHDLFEGLHARVALASDVEVVDDYPSTVLTHARRQRRWVRGDWQILLWLFPIVPAVGGPARNPVSLLGRWKILDNLRRSLVAPSLVVLLFAGWTVLPGHPAVWTGAALAVMATPVLFACFRLLAVVFARPVSVFLLRWRDDLETTFAQVTLSVVLLAYHAWDTVHAIGVTLVRLFVTQRRLLEWETAATAAARAAGLSGKTGLHTFELEMASSSLTALAAIVAIAPRTETTVWWSALPFVTAWIAAPALAYWLSRPVRAAEVTLTDLDRMRVRLWARRTWRYYERHVGPADHWLPPDNVQEDPDIRVARRTSPTNIGLALLATLAAHDLGYLTRRELGDRVAGTLDTLDGLERSSGHWLNWYDTETLAPLHPRYVSTVDSGNFAAALITLASGLDTLAAGENGRAALVEGLRDTALCLRQVATAARADPAGEHALADVSRLLEVLAAVAPPPEDVTSGWHARFEQLIDDYGPAADLELVGWTVAVFDAIERVQAPSPIDGDQDLPRQLRELAARCRTMATAMRFDALYDNGRQLMTIGRRVSDGAGPGEADASYYDLLASEARVASFLAIAHGQSPQRHWFRLGRPAVNVDGRPTLISWSASMFEYLMPTLVMRVFPGTLLDATCRRVVRRQIQHGRDHGVPWGVSESAYSVRDRFGTYQYKAFGVPGLGLKRGLGDELVVAPYATALALRFDPVGAIRNLSRLVDEGALGPLGFYDAIDYTARRTTDDAPAGPVVVRTSMAHHQGMMLVAFANAICDDVMVRRFHSDPSVEATELLLQERVPRVAASTPPRPVEETHIGAAAPPTWPRRFRTPHTYQPHTQFLSNGSYVVAVTNAGGGFATWRGLAVTRRRDDRLLEGTGQAIYVRDVRSGAVWSVGYHPVGQEPTAYLATFAPDKVTIRRTDDLIETELDVTVSPEDDAEVRRVLLTNRGAQPRQIEVTSYAEIVLDRHVDDVAHPVFSRLFIETEYVPESATLLARRRPRRESDAPVWLYHVLSMEGRTQGATECETSRERFIGRGRSPAEPVALDGRALSGTVGAVLDPVVSLRQRVRLAPGGYVRLAFVTGVASDRQAAILAAQRYHDRAAASRAFAMARTHTEMRLRHLGLTADHVRQFDRLASRVHGLDDSLRARLGGEGDVDAGIQALWAQGISGDIPLVLVRVARAEELRLVRQVLQAQEYWRLQGLPTDVAVVNDDPSGYLDDVQDQLTTIVQDGPWAGWKDRPGGVFLLRKDQLSPADHRVIAATARAVLDGARGELAQHLDRPAPADAARPREGAPAALPPSPAKLRPAAEALTMANGLGGFGSGGDEYVITLDDGLQTPAPWVNILANPRLGTVVSERGSAFTWYENSRENRLTSFANDPVVDPTSEALYLQDELGAAWSATPAPAGAGLRWTVRHRSGRSRFETSVGGLRQTLDVLVAPDAPVKISRLTIQNTEAIPRRLRFVGVAFWSLGPPGEGHKRYVRTRFDPEHSAVLAVNAFRDAPWRSRVAFVAMNLPTSSYTGDRRAFLGRHGTLVRPRCLDDVALDSQAGVDLDPCGALEGELVIGPQETREVVWLLGDGASVEESQELIRRHLGAGVVQEVTADVDRFWNDLAANLRVSTPDDSFDLLVNRWLQYQNVASRFLARTGFYQPGGAFGFRDQLQDVMPLVYSRPEICRAHILRAASRQFLEGDVQHWWQVPSGHGVRTTCSDDMLWLPHVVAYYIRATNDHAILDEVIPFLEGPALAPGEADAYGPATVSSLSGTLFDHCVRAIERAASRGQHGLPHIGGGDWNDGMNRVGHRGQGESVWLGWFLFDVLSAFAPLAERRHERALAERYATERERLRAALELAWDGEWYRRGYFDDGTPLGSATSEECRIDLIAQAWAVLSGAARADRMERAMDAVRSRLIRRDAQLALLLTPPFDQGTTDPGYIKGYPPGIRENGGQYTHAALWTVMALARLGYGDEAVELFHLLNPINHTRDTAGVARYRVEPYAVAADVSAHPQHLGRGGWTWYTASAGVMYRAAVEYVLGLRRLGTHFAVMPCVPAAWKTFQMDWRVGSARYIIHVDNSHGCNTGVGRATLDGRSVDPQAIPLSLEPGTHDVRIELGSGAPSARR